MKRASFCLETAFAHRDFPMMNPTQSDELWIPGLSYVDCSPLVSSFFVLNGLLSLHSRMKLHKSRDTPLNSCKRSLHIPLEREATTPPIHSECKRGFEMVGSSEVCRPPPPPPDRGHHHLTGNGDRRGLRSPPARYLGGSFGVCG
jgi:hypothetical protein